MNKSAQTTMNLVVLALAFIFLFGSFINSSDAETVVAGNFAVTWHDCEYGLTKQLCYVDIQNLDPTSNQPFNLSTVISDTAYIDFYSTNMIMYEWKALNTIIDTYNTTEINETRYNITYSQDNSTYTNETYYNVYNKTEVNGTETKKINQWKTTKSNMFKQGVREKMFYGSILIPKHESKEKFDDFGDIETINGTKRFKVEWTTPITQLDGAWGSNGKIAFWDENTDTEYHPYWNTSWSNRAPIEINSTENNTDYQVAINITYNANRLANFSDSRFTNENDIERPYWIENKSDGEWALVWVKTNLTTNNGTQLYEYYGNPTATSESNGTATFDFFDDAETGSITDLWALTSGAPNYDTGQAYQGSKSIKMDGGTSVTDTIDYATSGSSGVLEFNLYDPGRVETDEYIYGGFVGANLRLVGYSYQTALENYNRHDGVSWIDVGVVRSVGWHKMKIEHITGDGDWYIDGTTGSMTSSAADFTTIKFNRPNWAATIFYIDNIFYRKYTATSPTYSIGAEESANTAPSIIANATSPATIYTDTDTTTNLTVTDPDSGDTLTAYIQFYVNDTAVGGVISTVVTNNTNTLVATLGSGNYTVGDNLTSEFWAGDGTVNTSKANMTVTVSTRFIVTLNSPIDEFNSSDNTQEFNFAVSGDESIYSCELFLNNTGYGTNSSTVNNTATVITANDTVTDGYYDWNINCTANELTNNSVTRQITIDATAPTYSLNSTNSTLAATDILHSLKWQDGTNLSGYIFSTNNTGTWINDTWTVMLGTSNWSNITNFANSTVGTIIQWKVYANDSFNNWNESETYLYTTTNTVPQINNITWATTSGDTDATLTYLQDIDYVIVNSTDADADSLNVTLSVKNPNEIYLLSNVSMTQNGDFWNYTADFSLNLNGTWTFEIYSNDTKEINYTSIIINVAKTTPSTFDGWFGYFTETIPTTSNITTLVTEDYDLIGIYDNFTNFENNWTAYKSAINDSKEQNVKSAISFYFGGDYSDTNYIDNVKNNITAEFVDLKSSPYTETVAMIIIELNSSGTETQKANFVNNISQKMANATTNLFPIYVKDFTSVQLDTSYTAPFTLPYNTYLTESAFINQEITYLRENTTLTRIYYNLTTTLKSRTQNYHNNIIHNLENPPTGTTTEDEFNVADIVDDGVVVFNNESIQQVYVLNLTDKTNDIWDKTNNEILEKNTDGNFSITLNAYDVANLIFKALDRFVFSMDYSTLYKVAAQENTYFNYTEGARSASWTVYGANDIKIELWDSSYGINNQFMIHYEYINSSYVVDYSDYMIVIIADKNGNQINDSIGDLDKTYFYVSFADYEDTDAWQNTKIAEIDALIDTYDTHIFIDGMDSGAMGTDFEIRIKAIADHINTNKGKEEILNDYTSYLLVSDYGDADMKESFCGRWNESVNDPNYYYENISVDVIRANWARTKNKQQLLMAFGDIDDMEKMAYCYAEYLVLYGTANNNTFKYGQPNFQTQREIYTKDVGIQLESTWSETTAYDWNRKFTKGTMHIDTVNHTWSFDDARSTSAELCFDLYNGAGTPSAAGPLRYTINMPNTSFDVSKVYNITYDEVASGTSFTWDTVCKPINAVDITNDGRYDIRVWCGSADGTSRCNTGLGFDVGNDLVEGTGVHSWYDSSAPNYPAVEGYGTVYGRDTSNNLTRNWNIYLNMNDTTSTSIDTVTTEINRSVATTTTYLNVTLDSSKDYNLTVVDNGTTMAIYDGIKVWNSTAFETIYPVESSDCDSNNPTFNDTTINGESYGSCTKTGANTFVRFSVPNLGAQVIQLAIDTTAPTVDAYYQWNVTNETFDLTYLSDESVTINWNVSDVSGINTSDCTIYYRNFDNASQTPMYNYVNEQINSGMDIDGYRNASCLSINYNSTSSRLYHNFTQNIEYLQYTAALDIDTFSQDGTYALFGNRLIKGTFKNHTTGANKTINYNIMMDNQTSTVGTFLVYLCNSSYTIGLYTSSPYCIAAGSYTAGISEKNSVGYYDGLTTTDENGYLGPLLVTETMYAIGSCSTCTTAGNAWLMHYTTQDNDYSYTSANGGSTWTNVGWEVNAFVSYFNNARFEANLTVSDNLTNSFNDYRFDYYGEIPNQPPALDLQTDNVTGGLVSFYDIHGVTETGNIWINVSVADNEGHDINCSFYLLNNDTSYNSTLLSDFELGSDFGTCPYEWNTSTLPDGDYRLTLSATDGVDTTNRTSVGFIRLASDTTAPVVTIYTPTTEDTKERTPQLNVSVDDVSTIVYSIDGAANVSACSSCTSYSEQTATIPLGTHNITVYATNDANLVGNATVIFRIYQDIGAASDGGAGDNGVIPIIDENETNITDVNVTIVDDVIEELTFFEKINYSLDKIVFDYPTVCLQKGITQELAYFGLDDDGKPIYDVVNEDEYCKVPLVVSRRPIVYVVSGILLLIALFKIYSYFSLGLTFRKYKAKIMKKKYISSKFVR